MPIFIKFSLRTFVIGSKPVEQVGYRCRHEAALWLSFELIDRLLHCKCQRKHTVDRLNPQPS
jgi:hypothetical protein